MINIGIIGCGVIDGVMEKWLENHNPKCNILVSDLLQGLVVDNLW